MFYTDTFVCDFKTALSKRGQSSMNVSYCISLLLVPRDKQPLSLFVQIYIRNQSDY